jgi:hypothetical protein
VTLFLYLLKSHAGEPARWFLSVATTTAPLNTRPGDSPFPHIAMPLIYLLFKNAHSVQQVPANIAQILPKKMDVPSSAAAQLLQLQHLHATALVGIAMCKRRTFAFYVYI